MSLKNWLIILGVVAGVIIFFLFVSDVMNIWSGSQPAMDSNQSVGEWTEDVVDFWDVVIPIIIFLCIGGLFTAGIFLYKKYH